MFELYAIVHVPTWFGLRYRTHLDLLGEFDTRDDAVGHAYCVLGFTAYTQFAVKFDGRLV